MNKNREKSISPTVNLNWKNKPNVVYGKIFPLRYLEVIGQPAAGVWCNKLIQGDNQDIMAWLIQEGLAGEITLIYVDPPFGTGSDLLFAGDPGNHETRLKAYTDKDHLDVYLQMMYERLALMNVLLADNGSIYVHLDDHVTHYVKVLMDELFGRDNMVNQIIWQRTGAHNDPQAYGRNYDSILFYQKSAVKIWNKPLVSYDEAHRKRYFRQDAEGHWYRLNNPTGKGYQDTTRDFGKGPIKPPRDRHWSVTQEQVDRWLLEDRIVYTSSGYPFVKKYLDELSGKQVQSIWSDLIPPRSSRELTGFPTQKPEKLLERIIRASSNEGDLVADFFCGSGTTPVVAEKLGRRWIGCDASEKAVQITKDRLKKIPDISPFEVMEVNSTSC